MHVYCINYITFITHVVIINVCQPILAAVVDDRKCSKWYQLYPGHLYSPIHNEAFLVKKQSRIDWLSSPSNWSVSNNTSDTICLRVAKTQMHADTI